MLLLIRIQQYVGIITCMGLVLLRANEMDREDCTCGEESSSWESQSVTLYGVFHTWCINGFNCSRLVTLIKYISGYIPNVIIVSRPDLFPKPMRAGGYYPLFTYKLLKIDAVLRHSKLRDILVESFHRAHIRVQVEAGSGLSQDHSNSRPQTF